MEKKCNKVSFASEKFAMEHVDRIKKTSTRSIVPLRAYYCYEHKAWHLTSAPDKSFIGRMEELQKKVKEQTGYISQLEKKINELRQRK
jgi:hypothetical protein